MWKIRSQARRGRFSDSQQSGSLTGPENGNQTLQRKITGLRNRTPKSSKNTKERHDIIMVRKYMQGKSYKRAEWLKPSMNKNKATRRSLYL
ncbi:hypothetical protein GAZ87_18375 [Phocaeicola vulgatus]|uniref:Uncharacterized protein n=1 Tax=Phocaeicola vulgatus TaxID=821 RepID=A0A6I1AQD5_PHOVU|nr:hypothetical protein GAZ81_17180 [Phocaeicola vulgatus]KAB6595431.1 hypothetical protein GAZ65_16475 [Phocaeicola vulgatus]KAB6604491.1 hypothetical protein GAZ67_18375 [Phocaeicola vulgatus]KAB6607473.1 hypothetical protein GAZ74_17465 [Phocaeicola vulgatus]KAB6612833.1 hypothetical protein GAY10_16810 [Phocaeicola vulgatus]